MTALTEIDWLLLQTLCINPIDVAIPALMKGNWPELKDLSIGSAVSDGLEWLADFSGSTLQRLQLNFGTISPSDMYCLI